MSNFFKANYLFPEVQCKIVPSKVRRNWMDITPNKFAYRCLPLSIANQCSYDVLAPSSIKAKWNGDMSYDAVIVEYLDEHNFDYASSEFGSGVLTFHVDFVINSSPNTCLFVKGPANSYKQKINALEAIVETHWLPFTFTFNWMFNEPGEVVFSKNEPMFSFFPINLDYIESFSTEVAFLEDNHDLHNSYTAYADSRKQHLINGTTNGADWQKYYMKGISPINLAPNENHKSTLSLKEFNYTKLKTD